MITKWMKWCLELHRPPFPSLFSPFFCINAIIIFPLPSSSKLLHQEERDQRERESYSASILITPIREFNFFFFFFSISLPFFFHSSHACSILENTRHTSISKLFSSIYTYTYLCRKWLISFFYLLFLIFSFLINEKIL